MKKEAPSDGGSLVPPSREGDSCTVEMRVRYAECDAMGHLHHARYWELFEQVRTELLRINGVRYRDLEAQGVFFVVYKAACTYLAPIAYDELVAVSVTVERLTRTRVDHSYEIRCGGRLCCRATTTLACVGRDGRPQAIPGANWTGR